MPMPKTRNVESLSEKCLNSIANHLANYDPSNVRVANPFDKWPSQVLEKVIGALRSQKKLNIDHRELLITPQTKELDLTSVSGFREIPQRTFFLTHAAVRCPKIETLRLGYDALVDTNDKSEVKNSLEYFRQFLPQFKHLQVLDVSNSHGMFDDSCMHILGLHCRNLRHLNICCCHVTDDGVEGLCGGEADIGKEMLEGQRGQCKSLQKFEIVMTRITQKGAQIALQNLPDLKHFNSFDIAEALVHMHRNDLNPPSYALLAELYLIDLFPSESYGSIALRLATSFCPFLLRLSINHLQGITDSDLLSLIALERLSILRSYNLVPSNDASLTFDRGLAVVLKAIGSSLKQLELEEVFMSLRLESILEYCPNLEILSISCCSYSTLSSHEDEQSSRPSKRAKTHFAWPNLKKLHLTETATLPPESLLLALTMTSAPNLEELAIYDCEALDDDILHRAFQIHPFNKLSSLTLYDCNAVTKNGVDLFIQNGNALKEASFRRCESLSVEDFDYWLNESEKNNWNFEMVAESYN